MSVLVSKFCLDELAVETGDVSDGFALRTYCLAGTCVGTVTESEFVHLGYHCLCTAGSLNATLWKECELAYLRADEEHSRTVLTCCYAGTATDTAGAVHCFVGVFLGDEDGVGILWSSCAYCGVAACSA